MTPKTLTLDLDRDALAKIFPPLAGIIFNEEGDAYLTDAREELVHLAFARFVAKQNRFCDVLRDVLVSLAVSLAGTLADGDPEVADTLRRALVPLNYAAVGNGLDSTVNMVRTSGAFLGPRRAAAADAIETVGEALVRPSTTFDNLRVGGDFDRALYHAADAHFGSDRTPEQVKDYVDGWYRLLSQALLLD
jgi:hypothetical protein